MRWGLSTDFHPCADFGLPSLPSAQDGALSDIIDREGNPAEGFMQKATAWMQKRFPKLFANEESNPMKKVFACLCAMLAVKDFEVTDGKVTLTDEQMGAVEDRLAQLEKDVENAKEAEKAAKDTQADLQTKLDKAVKDVAERDTQIANLKNAPGAEDTVPAGESGNAVGQVTAQSMLNEIKDL